jgi:hypothetical protein
MNTSIIISVTILCSIIISYYFYNIEHMSANNAAEIAMFPVRFVEAFGKALLTLLPYAADAMPCASGYTTFPLTCTKGCGGYWNESWGREWCNGPKIRPDRIYWGWDDCYSSWLVSCTNDGKGGHPAHTYDREMKCKHPNHTVIAGTCWPKIA